MQDVSIVTMMTSFCIESKDVESEIVYQKKLKAVETMFQTNPNWLQLPIDVKHNILDKLSVVDKITTASLACPLWWSICKEPTMWCTIDMNNPRHALNYDLVKICKYAIDRSCGKVEDIYIENFGNDELLQYIADK